MQYGYSSEQRYTKTAPGLRNHQAHYNRTHNANWRKWALYMLLGAGVATSMYVYAPALALLLIFIGVNTLIEYHKWFTAGLPLDFELLYVGTAYIALTYSLSWAFALVFLGPAVSELARGSMNKEALMKSASLAVTALVASAASAHIMLFIAVLAGLAVQYVAASLVYNCSVAHNIVRRLSTLCFASYILFVFL